MDWVAKGGARQQPPHTSFQVPTQHSEMPPPPPPPGRRGRALTMSTRGSFPPMMMRGNGLAPSTMMMNQRYPPGGTHFGTRASRKTSGSLPQSTPHQLAQHNFPFPVTAPPPHFRPMMPPFPVFGGHGRQMPMIFPRHPMIPGSVAMRAPLHQSKGSTQAPKSARSKTSNTEAHTAVQSCDQSPKFPAAAQASDDDEMQSTIPPLQESSQLNVPLEIGVTLGEREASSCLINELSDKNTREQDAASILLGLRSNLQQSSNGGSELVRRTPSHDSNADSVPSLSSSTASSNIPSSDSSGYPNRLVMPDDEVKLNSMHCFLRSELLEVFVVETRGKQSSERPRNMSGRVGFRCVHCAIERRRNSKSLLPMLPTEGEAPMAVFYPKSLSEIYRLVTSWQRVHLRKCHSLPPSVRTAYQTIKQNDKTRGKTQYWIDSALELGLANCPSKAGGIRFTSLLLDKAPEDIESEIQRTEAIVTSDEAEGSNVRNSQ